MTASSGTELDFEARVASTLVCLVGSHPDLGQLAAALAQRGFQPRLLAPSQLYTQLAEQRPAALIAEVTPVTQQALEQLRSLPGLSALQLILLTDQLDAPASLSLGLPVAASFSRPLEYAAVADKIEQLVRVGAGLLSLSELPELLERLPDASSTGPLSIAPIAGSSHPQNSMFPAAPMLSYAPNWTTPQPPPVSSAPPQTFWSSTGSAAPPGAPSWNRANIAGPTTLSPDLEQLLASAEQQVSNEPFSPSDVPSPEDEVNAILPPEVLAALDEPLEVESHQELTGSHEDGSHGTARDRRSATRSDSRETTARPVTTAEASVALEPHNQSSLAVTAQPPAPSLPNPNALPTSRPTPLPATVSPPRRFDAQPPVVAVPVQPPPPVISVPSRARPMAQAQVDKAPDTPRVVPAQQQRPAIPPPQIALSQSPSAPTAKPAPEAKPASSVTLPASLGAQHDGLWALAQCIANCATGCLCLEDKQALRRAILRDGDPVTCGSSSPDESLLAYLVAKGELPRTVSSQLAGRIPLFGRHAAAALIANGYLGQDQLWTALRAHAEWLLSRMAAMQSGSCSLEADAPGRLKAEPAVFGATPGAEVLVELGRRILPSDKALQRLGGPRARLGEGPKHSLLSECSLTETERKLIERASGLSVEELVKASGEPSFAALIASLVELGVLQALPSIHPEKTPQHTTDDSQRLDAQAVRQRVAARLSVIEEGDYFQILGVARTATSYEIRRAYLEARRSFEPSRLLTGATADLWDDVQLIVEMVEEAYEVLRDEARCSRYRQAIEAQPPDAP